MGMATGEVPAEVAAGELAEMPEIVKKVQEAVCQICFFERRKRKVNYIIINGLDFVLVQWDKVEDKYAVSSLAVSGFVALWASAGVVSVSILILYEL